MADDDVDAFGGLDDGQLAVRAAGGKCAVCGKAEGRLSRCSRCHFQLYCSPECQRTDWRQHKMICVHAAMMLTSMADGVRGHGARLACSAYFGMLKRSELDAAAAAAMEADVRFVARTVGGDGGDSGDDDGGGGGGAAAADPNCVVLTHNDAAHGVAHRRVWVRWNIPPEWGGHAAESNYVPCPVCGKLYPSQKDVKIHKDKRHRDLLERPQPLGAAVSRRDFGETSHANIHYSDFDKIKLPPLYCLSPATDAKTHRSIEDLLINLGFPKACRCQHAAP